MTIKSVIFKAWLLILNSSPLSLSHSRIQNLEIETVHPGTLFMIDVRDQLRLSWGSALIDRYPTDVSLLGLSEDTSLLPSPSFNTNMHPRNLQHHRGYQLVLGRNHWRHRATRGFCLYSPAGSRTEPLETQSSQKIQSDLGLHEQKLNLILGTLIFTDSSSHIC